MQTEETQEKEVAEVEGITFYGEPWDTGFDPHWTGVDYDQWLREQVNAEGRCRFYVL